MDKDKGYCSPSSKCSVKDICDRYVGNVEYSEDAFRGRYTTNFDTMIYSDGKCRMFISMEEQE